MGNMGPFRVVLFASAVVLHIACAKQNSKTQAASATQGENSPVGIRLVPKNPASIEARSPNLYATDGDKGDGWIYRIQDKPPLGKPEGVIAGRDLCLDGDGARVPGFVVEFSDEDSSKFNVYSQLCVVAANRMIERLDGRELNLEDFPFVKDPFSYSDAVWREEVAKGTSIDALREGLMYRNLATSQSVQGREERDESPVPDTSTPRDQEGW